MAMLVMLVGLGRVPGWLALFWERNDDQWLTSHRIDRFFKYLPAVWEKEDSVTDGRRYVFGCSLSLSDLFFRIVRRRCRLQSTRTHFAWRLRHFVCESAAAYIVGFFKALDLKRDAQATGGD